jgi:hypothetical protein
VGLPARVRAVEAGVGRIVPVGQHDAGNELGPSIARIHEESLGQAVAKPVIVKLVPGQRGGRPDGRLLSCRATRVRKESRSRQGRLRAFDLIGQGALHLVSRHIAGRSAQDLARITCTHSRDQNGQHRPRRTPQSNPFLSVHPSPPVCRLYSVAFFVKKQTILGGGVSRTFGGGATEFIDIKKKELVGNPKNRFPLILTLSCPKTRCWNSGTNSRRYIG